VSAQVADASEAAPAAALRPMRDGDLDAVMDIERRAYPFPWTRGIFRDCLRAGYPALVLVAGGSVVGYGLLSVAAGEAHILNVCADPALPRQGHGRRLLRALLLQARGRGAQRVFLEVRPSNPAAIALYDAEGFNEIGRRPRYYPAASGREDAIVMALELADNPFDAQR
jgi:ribosomal-protein-alanine N-acetyltransferase